MADPLSGEPIAVREAATARLVLRPLAETDRVEYERVLRVSRDAWAPWTPATDPTLAPAELFRRERIRATDGARAGTHLRLAAFTAEGALAGLFGLNEIVRGVFQSAYASWQVAADLAGAGYGTEGVRAILGLAFADAPNGLALHRVQANVMPSNGASLRIAEKVGFRREGLARAYLRIAGAWEDHVMLAITREEWASNAR